MILPTFIVGGAPRAGTTFLYEVLDEHPDVFMAKPRTPEPKFFLIDDEFQKGLAYYSERYFSGALGGRCTAVGEKSTNYLESPVAARRIRTSLPDVKLLFALRNPIERAFSNYLWSTKNGLETLSFEEAIKTEAVRESQYAPEHRYSRPFSYVSRGMYATLLEPFFAAFRPAQIHVVILEDLEDNPQPHLDAIWQYLGVPPYRPQGDLHRRVNTARQGDEQISEKTRARLRDIYRRPNEELAALLKQDFSRWT